VLINLLKKPQNFPISNNYKRVITFLADTHVGALHAVFPEGFHTYEGTQADTVQNINPVQKELLEDFKNFAEQSKKYGSDTMFVIGDLIAGMNPAECGRAMMFADMDQQIQAWVFLINQYYSHIKNIYILKGTGFHEAKYVDLLEKAVDKLTIKGFKAIYLGSITNAEICSKPKQIIANIAHEGANASVYPETPMARSINDMLRGVALDKVPKAKLIIRGHKHVWEHIDKFGVHFIQVPCFPNGVQVLTPNGYKNIENIQVNESVIGKETIAKVEKVFENDYDGELYNIKPLYLESIPMTPEHPVLTAKIINTNTKGKRERKPFIQDFKEAKDLTLKDYVVVPKIKTEEEIKLKFPTLKRAKYIQNSILNDDWATIIGWYIAEGDANKNVRFSMDKNETDNIQEIVNTLKRLGFNPTVIDEESTTRIIVCSNNLAEFLIEQCGKGSHNKHLPLQFMKMNKEPLRIIMDCMMKGDGYKDVDQKYLTTVSKRLVKETQIAMLKLDKPMGYHTFIVKDSEIKGRVIKGGIAYRLSSGSGNEPRYYQDENNWYFKIYNIEKQQYNGKVYNLMTTESLYTIPFIVHNCWQAFVPYEKSRQNYYSWQPDIGGVLVLIDEECRIRVWEYLYKLPHLEDAVKQT